MNALTTMPPEDNKRAVVTLGGAPQALVPNSLAGVWKMAEIIAASGIAPREMNTPEKISVAILHGLELRLTPMQALQRIAVVNGRPTLWGDGAVSLVRSSGLCEYIRERIEGEGDDRVAVCEAKRKGEDEATVRTFSVAEAKKANLWGKSGPWSQFPNRMLQMRARAFALRDLFADVLGGLYLREEMEDDRAGRPREQVFEADGGPPPAPPIDLPDMRRATAVIEHKPAAPVAVPPEQPAAPVPRAQAQAVVADPAAAASNSDLVQRAWSEVLAEIQGHLDGARTIDDVSDIRTLYSEEAETLTRSQREAFDYAFEQAENRFSKPVERVEAPEVTKEPAAAETAQEPAVEDWAAYGDRIRRLAEATHDEAGAAGLRKVWKAGKDYRALMEQREACTRQQRVALTALVQDAIKRAEAPAPAAEAAPAAATVPGVTDQDPGAVRACGERIFSALSTAPTKERAFVIWSRSANEREQCGASAEVLDAWAKEYREIRKRLPEEA